MCFAPRRCALFRPLNIKKWSEHVMLCTFWLGNVLRATTACNFSSILWPAGSAPAALARLLFDPPESQIIGKNTVNRDFPTFSHTCIFSLLTFLHLLSFHFLTSPSWLFPPLLFHLSLLSEVWLLKFRRTSCSIRWFALCSLHTLSIIELYSSSILYHTNLFSPMTHWPNVARMHAVLQMGFQPNK